MVILPTFAYDFTDNVVVIVHAPVPPDDEDWSLLLKDTRTYAPSVKGCLVVAGKSYMRPLQREQLAETLRGMRFKVAVLTSSVATREDAEVLRTQGTTHLAFGEIEIEAALDYLGLQRSVRPLVTQRVKRIRSLLEEVHRASQTEGSMNAPAAPASPLRDFAKACGMSQREREVIFSLLSGDSRAQIASALGVSEGSIHTYVSRACAKAGAASESELLRTIIRFLARNLGEGDPGARN
jgi:DNA-binding CsgD family transcriptional regulator